MTLEQAITEMGELYSSWTQGQPPRDDMEKAFALVLAAAKRPRVYALGEEERKTLEYLLGDQRDAQAIAPAGYAHKHQPTIDALTAALALEQPEEPFMVEELKALEEALGDTTGYSASLIAKLRAYIEKKEKE